MPAVAKRLQAAYSIIRESFSIGLLSRLKRFEGNPADPGEPYEIYRGLLGALISAAAAMKFWYDESRIRLEGVKCLEDCVKDSAFGFDHPLYQQEILWLINERALTAFVQGLYDAIPLFNRALRVARQVTDSGETDDSFRATERRVLLNLAIAEIERGHIEPARRRLEELAQRKLRTADSTPSLTKELAEGYLGLCVITSAVIWNERNCVTRTSCACRVPAERTLAIFHRHYADLLRLLKRTEEIQTHLRLATLAAARDEQKDVIQHALIAQSRLYRGYWRSRRAQGSIPPP